MSATETVAESTPLDAAYQAQRLRLAQIVSAAAAEQWIGSRIREQTIGQTVQIVTAGQTQTVHLVDAYMTAKTLQATGQGVQHSLDPTSYTTALLRGVSADDVYSRPFGAYQAFINKGADEQEARRASLASLDKLVRTDLQLAQTNAARDWMTEEPTIVGYRRVLTGPGPHCALCSAAATRTYKTADLMPIHEHCGCTVRPLWGKHAVASVGTVVKVEHDPELGPRLMAADWAPVGPRLTS